MEHRSIRTGLIALSMFAISILSVSLVLAEADSQRDWPQVGGPNRDYRVGAPPLATQWLPSGPKTLWKRKLGKGYSGIAVAGDRLFTMYREGSSEATIAADLETGATIWEKRHSAPFAEYHRMEHGTGPHVTPLVVENLVLTAGIHGDLIAYDAENGNERWRREIVRDLGGTKMDRGYSNSPIVWRDDVIVPVGGKGQAVMAFDIATGRLVWKNQDFDNSYSSPTLIEVDGQEQLIFLTRDDLVALDPDGGGLLWSHPHPTSYGLNISVPIFSPSDNLLFLSSAYNGGSRVLELSQLDGSTKVKELWANKRMRIHIGNAMRVGDVVWGANGDFGAVPFTGVDIRSGEIVHRTREVARAFQVLADGKLILLDEDGVLAIATPKPDRLIIHAEHQLLDSKTWTPPTLVGRVLLARDQDSLIAVELP